MATPQESLSQLNSGNAASIAELSNNGSFLNNTMGAEMLFFACLVLALVALASIANVMKNRKQVQTAARNARAHAEEVRNLFDTMRMAESLAGIGVWQFSPITSEQKWSDGMKRLFDLDGEEAFVAGDAETLLLSNGVDLVGSVQKHHLKTEPFSMQFELSVQEDDTSRVIALQACNLRGRDNKIERIIAIARDETENVEREKELESHRKEAEADAEQARILADTDPLTGLVNKRRIMAELDKRVVDAKVTQMPLVLIMFDIDRFKQINDKYGHESGDKVLQRVARLASAQARKNDLLGRVGGEEFVLILGGSSEGMARIMSERLRQGIANCSSVGALPAVTISLGYSCLQPDDTALSLFARADSALHDAKQSGRNRVRMAA